MEGSGGAARAAPVVLRAEGHFAAKGRDLQRERALWGALAVAPPSPHTYRAAVGGRQASSWAELCLCVSCIFKATLQLCLPQLHPPVGALWGYFGLGIFCICEEGQNWGHAMMWLVKWGPEQSSLGVVSPCAAPVLQRAPEGVSAETCWLEQGGSGPSWDGSGHLGGSLRTAGRQTDRG